MPKIVKLSALLHAVRLEEVISAPGPDGEEIDLAGPGWWVVYAETDDGFDFKGFLTDREYREKHLTIG
jgi:hypothetical protein